MARWFRVKKIVSYILLFTIFMSIVVFDAGVVYAASNPKVTITTTFTRGAEFYKTEKRLFIDDEEIGDWINKSVTIIEHGVGMLPLSNIQESGGWIQADLEPNWIIEAVRVEGYIYDSEDNRKSVSKEYKSIGEAGVPQIENAESYSIRAGDPIILNVSGDPNVFADSSYTFSVGGVLAEATVVTEQEKIKLKPLYGNFPNGSVDIKISKIGNEESRGYILEAAYLYKDAVHITGNLNLDGVTMFPTMGGRNSKVYFTADSFPNGDGYDIYFIKDLNNPKFPEENMVKNVTKGISNDSKETLTGLVPDLDPGPYHVVFTNANSQRDGIKSMFILQGQQYQLVNITQNPEIVSVYPNSAPAGTPTRVTIRGQYFVNHNIPGFEPKEVLNIDDDVKVGTTEVTIDYGVGTLKLEGEEKTYDVKVERKIEVYIGRKLAFEGKGFEPEKDVGDSCTFTVKTIDFALDETQIEDVVIRVTTEITEIEGSEVKNNGFRATMEYEARYKEPFTYYPSTETPVVNEVIPNIIPIEEGSDNKYYIHSSIDKLLLTIRGDKFLVTRYEEGEEEKINYPIITLGGTVINPNENASDNEYKPIKFEVLKDGKVVDGTTNNEIGDTISIVLKAGGTGENVFEIGNKESRILSIKNPRRLSDTHSTEIHFLDIVSFLEIDINDFPVIDSVRPSMVSIDGGEEVTITGSNFRPGARVYVDNKLVENINISGDMKEITFTVPRGDRPGDTLLHVINPGGGLAAHVFTYTETYTQPELDYINPKEGTTNTLVTVKGANFLPPDPTVVISSIDQIDQSLIYRLIGTRIFIDGHDINEYNMGSQNRIELRHYDEGEEIFKYSEVEEKIVLGESYDSVVLYDNENNKFYTIVRDAQNNYSIEGGEGIRYEVRYKEDEKAIYAGEYKITENNAGILKFDELELKAYTPYKVQDGKIVGHRVKFIDSNTLTFKVPNLNLSPWRGEGYYDVSIVNPDTKSQTIRDGFYFFASSYTRPKIDNIVPDRGPDVGGNIIHIYGPEPNPEDENDHRIGFVDTGTLKTKVFIGGQQVPEEDVNVLPGGRLIEIKVPETIEDIRSKGTDRITVPIVVVNPDGGSYSVSYEDPLEVGGKIIRGYTYLVPTSNPKINSIEPKQGSAGGGYIVEIFGSDFRDFEPYIDLDGNGERDEGEPFDDIDGNKEYTSKAPDTKEQSRYNPDYDYLVSPLIPKVYFGNKLAEVVEFSTGYLQVVVPPLEESIVDVYVVNNDSGISNKVKFRYEASNPTIETIVPSAGDFRGGTKIGIYGRNLENNTLTLIRKDDEGNITEEVVNMPLVRFGNNTNENLPREAENSGVIRSDRATVKLEGDLEVTYDAKNRKLTAAIEENKGKYTFTYEGYTGEEIFINTKDFKNDGANYPYEMLIRVVVDTNRLLVSGNFAPEAEYYNRNQVTAITPVYFEIGRTPVFIINPDKGEGRGYFEYKYPDSDPKIVNVTKDGGEEPIEEYREEIGGQAKVLAVDHKGGNRVTIHGTDFREGAIIKIANILTISDIEYNLPTELTFTMPAVPEAVVGRLLEVVVENRDGGTADSSMNKPPIYIEFIKGESDPEIHAISPQEGPATGGTKVIITGNDFRNVMERHPKGVLKVYFGDEEAKSIKFIDYKTIEAIAPESKVFGDVQIRVKNPDDTITQDNIRFTYISKPKIMTISPNKIFTNDTETEVTITGQMFMQGAKVVVGGQVVNISNLKADMDIKGQGLIGVDSQGNNRQVAVVGGIEAASVTVESENVIKVRFNEATNLENHSIIIINPDGGISDPYDDFQYEIPVPGRPIGLTAIPGYESTVQLIWHESDENILNKATRYEIYGKLSKDSTYTFIGDTTEAEFLVKDLEPQTRYDFRVRALNEYGTSIGYATVRVRTLTVRQDEKLRDKEDKIDKEDKKIEREGKEEFKNDTVTIITGSKALSRGIVNLRHSKYDNINKFTIQIPIEYTRSNKELTIKDGTLTLKLNLKDLYTQEVRRNDKGNKDAYVNIHIGRISEHHIPRGKRLASKAYEIDFSYQYGKNTININTLVNPARLTLEQDKVAYPHTKNTKLYIFNKEKGQYEETSTWANVKTSSRFILLADR